MPLYHILILALIQGLTEFLPVSSSGHLVIIHNMLGEGQNDLCWDTNRMMDVAVHVGTLLSVLVYFWRDLWAMLVNIVNFKSAEFRLILNLTLASIPVIIAGFIIHKIEPSFLCLIEVMAWMTIIFGIVLWIADRFFSDDKTLNDMGFLQAGLIGLSQALALVPGTSRSGITMTAARFLGFKRTEAARFSLLLSIVAIGGAGFLSSLDLIESGDMRLGSDVLIAVVLSFLAGWGAIAVMMRWLQKSSFTPFAVYRVILGLIILAILYV